MVNTTCVEVWNAYTGWNKKKYTKILVALFHCLAFWERSHAV